MSIRGLLKEFKPAVLFIGKFLAVYFILNTTYAFYIENFSGAIDPITYWVSEQTVAILNLLGEETSIYSSEFSPNAFLSKGERHIIAVYEGCNGINIIILFFAFIVAFKGSLYSSIWFTITGILAIHLWNLVRIVLLYYVAAYYPNYMYFSHKYAFTAVIYLCVFSLWYIWAIKINGDHNQQVVPAK